MVQEPGGTRLGDTHCSPRAGDLRKDCPSSSQTPEKGTTLIFPDFGSKQEPSAALITLGSLQSPKAAPGGWSVIFDANLKIKQISPCCYNWHL